MNETEAITLLINFFGDNKLSFRKIAILEKYWDKAVLALDEKRSEQWAEYHLGYSPMPDMPDMDTEGDFYYTMEEKVGSKLSDKGVRVGEGALSHIVDMVIEMAEIKEKDFYYYH